MRRATTPTHYFIFPDNVQVENLDELLIVYSQNGTTILKKNLDDMSIYVEENRLSLALTQEETNKFAPGKALVQIRARINDGVMVSKMKYFDVKPVLDSEEM